MRNYLISRNCIYLITSVINCLFKCNSMSAHCKRFVTIGRRVTADRPHSIKNRTSAKIGYCSGLTSTITEIS